jgi:hypothetical protein
MNKEFAGAIALTALHPFILLTAMYAFPAMFKNWWDLGSVGENPVGSPAFWICHLGLAGAVLSFMAWHKPNLNWVAGTYVTCVALMLISAQVQANTKNKSKDGNNSGSKWSYKSMIVPMAPYWSVPKYYEAGQLKTFPTGRILIKLPDGRITHDAPGIIYEYDAPAGYYSFQSEEDHEVFLQNFKM